MSDLPVDLEEEILSRVPTTSLKRLRSTCKRWNALRFSEKHLCKAPKQSHVLMFKEYYRLCPMSVDLNVVPPSIGFKDALSLKNAHSNSGQVDIAQVFHCDGLLLCITKIDNKPVIWNPCLGESRWIKHENGYDRNCEFALGYANNQSCRSYRVLRFYQTDDLVVAGPEIYEFNSNSWRVVNAPNCLRICKKYRGVTLKGSTYWLFYDGDKDSDYLLSFDFTREIFRRLHLSTSRDYYMALSVVRQEELSVLIESIGSYELEIWVTKKIDTEAEFSWSKSFAVDLRNTPRNVLSSVFMISFLIDEEKKVALCCSSSFAIRRTVVFTLGEDDEYAKVLYEKEIRFLPSGLYWRPFIFNYVPNLVQIQ
ncbi:hypothetical protein EUTSA_v10022250mg [Eutrema salsugineum]|uniref:F-box domain-containing protein n=1 Tax=Eutrema salsugineum TaxID=72664 RepID=V4M5Q6_EUTSA|nr:putative F-box only protein 9 [Eutrema salsugineum]ESQ47613.1 hypothetical protein EUTSA_v10022250mg [Eutrema salsugineum]